MTAKSAALHEGSVCTLYVEGQQVLRKLKEPGGWPVFQCGETQPDAVQTKNMATTNSKLFS